MSPAASRAARAGPRPAGEERPFTRRTKARYRRVLDAVERRPARVLIGVGVLALAAAAVVPFLGGDFIPTLKEGNYIVHMTLVPGSSLEQSIALGDRVATALLKLPYVTSVVQSAGGAGLGVAPKTPIAARRPLQRALVPLCLRPRPTSGSAPAPPPAEPAVPTQPGEQQQGDERDGAADGVPR